MSLKYADLSELTNSELVDIIRSLGLEVVYVGRESDTDKVWWSEWSQSPHVFDDSVVMFLAPNARTECAYGQSDLMEQSNYRSLQRDFPGIFTEMSWVNVSGLGIRADRLTGDIVNAIAGLVDYPLYDEDDHSALEQETFESAVSDYLLFDGMRWHMEDDDADAMREFANDAQAQAFFAAASNLEVWPEFEYSDVIFRDDDMRALMAETLRILVSERNASATLKDGELQ